MKKPNTASSKKRNKNNFLKKISKKTKRSLGTCFVIMPLREPFNLYFETIIKPAVCSANLTPIRSDSLFTPTPIMGDIWEMIQNSKVILAELTTKNANVFYEMGLGHAIGKPIVLVSETMEDVPFDLQSLRVINYNKNDPDWGYKLKSDIKQSLLHTLDNTIDAVPPMFRKKVKSQGPEESEALLRISNVERKLNFLAEELFKNKRNISSSIDTINDQVLDKLLLDRWNHNVNCREDAIIFAKENMALGIPVSSIHRFIRNKTDDNEANNILKIVSKKHRKGKH